MKVNRAELVLALDKVIDAVANDEIVPQLTNFRIYPEEIIGFNMELSIVTEMSLGMDALIPADKFHKLIKKLKDEEIELEIVKESLRIKAKGHKSSIQLGSPEDFPEVPREYRKWEKIPDEFDRGIRLVLAVTSDDETMAELNGVYFDGKNIVGSDSHQIAWFELKEEIKIEPVIISKPLAKEIIKLGNPSGVVSKGGSIAFKYSDTIVIGKAIEAEFPSNWKDFFGGKKNLIPIPEELGGMVSRIKDFSGEKVDEALVFFSFKGNKIIVSYKGESEEIEEMATGKEKIEDVTFEVNPYHLKSCINGTENFCLMDNGFYAESKDSQYHYIVSVLTGGEPEEDGEEEPEPEKKKPSGSRRRSKK